MYEAFYGLNEKPFNLTPDPRFLYLSVKHQEAFAHLLYGIRRRSGFIMVTGEIGTGKTIICRSLLRDLDPDTEVAYIFNPKLTPEDLLRTINADFGIVSAATTVRGLIDELNEYLLEQSAKGKNCVLIIDEAQNLETETLEQVRLLSNLETETEKLIQIVLIGQPELQVKLKLTELRQLNQRITARYHLTGLSRPDTLKYIALRLKVAGGGRKQIHFSRGAIRRIYRSSKGIPRVINAICDRALLVGYTRETREITADVVKQAAREVQGERGIGRRIFEFGPLKSASALIAVVLIALAAVVISTSGPLPTLNDAGEFAQSGWQRLVGWTGVFSADPSSASVPESDQPDGQGAEGTRVAGAMPKGGTPVGSSADDDASTRKRRQPTNVVEAASRSDAEDSALRRVEAIVSRANAKPANQGELKRLPLTRETVEGELDQPPPKVVARGISSLLLAWGLNELDSAPETPSIEDVQRFAASNSLSFVVRKLSLKQIALTNLPALARVNRRGEESWVAVLAIDGDKVTISDTAGVDEHRSKAQFEQTYSGEVAYIWDASKSGALVLRAESAGPAVVELQKDLKALGLSGREPTGVYDGATIQVVSKIQRATGLRVDGIVGSQTRMVLENWLGKLKAPALIEQRFSDAMRADVLASVGIVVASVSSGNAEVAPAAAIPPASDPVSPPAGEELEVSGEDPRTNEFPGITDVPPVEPLEEVNFVLPDDDEAGLDAAVAQPLPAEDVRVSVEQLEGPGYRPQLEVEWRTTEDGLTASAAPIVPIVPRSGER